MKKITIIILGLLLALSMFNSPIWGQEQIEGIPYKLVNLIDKNPSDTIFNIAFSPEVVGLLTYKGEKEVLKIQNNTDSTFTIQNYASPTTLLPDFIISGNQSHIDTFYCATDSGTWKFRIKLSTQDTLIVINLCKPTPTPSLTQWGMIILIALIIVTGVYLWLRRKPVTA
jgi:hypothetical protein